MNRERRKKLRDIMTQIDTLEFLGTNDIELAKSRLTEQADIIDDVMIEEDMALTARPESMSMSQQSMDMYDNVSDLLKASASLTKAVKKLEKRKRYSYAAIEELVLDAWNRLEETTGR